MKAPKTVGQLMSKKLITVDPSDSLKVVAGLFKTKALRHVPVVDEDGALVGLVSHRDFLTVSVSKLAHIAAKEESDIQAHIPVRDIMGRKITTVTEKTTLKVAAGIMLKGRFGCLPVLRAGKLVGIVTESDYLRVFAS